MGADIKRYKVLALRKLANGEKEYHAAGVAYANRDATLTVHLDVLPIDGMLLLRPDVPEVA